MTKRKFTWIDLAVVIILLVGIAGTAYKFSKANVSAPVVAAKDKILITFYMENLQNSTIDAIKKGDPVVEAEQGSNFGKVREISRGDSIFWSSDEEGQLVSSSREGYSSLKLTMEAEGVINKNGVSIDKSVYYVGQTITLYAGGSMLKDGRISKIAKLP